MTITPEGRILDITLPATAPENSVTGAVSVAGRGARSVTTGRCLAVKRSDRILQSCR